MKTPSGPVTNREVTFGEDEIIVSKTDVKGRILYANPVFIRLSGYSESELLGQPHSIIRHPDMPRCVFKLLWDTIAAGQEIFAYVKNLAKDGSFYWVLAHVTPTFSNTGEIIGYHSNRRKPERPQVGFFSELYRKLLAEESKHSDWREGMSNATQMLLRILAQKGMTYEEFIFSGLNGRTLGGRPAAAQHKIEAFHGNQ
jgi:PAS domain S-box-containing protein